MNLFAPSILYAGISEARIKTSHEDPLRVSAEIRYGSASIAQFDFDSARGVAERFGESVFDASLDDMNAFRNTIFNLIELARPAWRRTVLFGRAAVFKLLDADTLQSIQVASLADAIPDLDCAKWWTNLEARIRVSEAESLTSDWRDAEFRTLLNERKKLSGTDLVPIWTSLDDNTAGFDISSWELPVNGLPALPKYIEVKYSSSIPRFFISRNEWGFAVRHPKAWELQFWLGERSEPILREVTWLEQHIALNRGNGRWESMLIEAEI